jgi:hypothetical protein
MVFTLTDGGSTDCKIAAAGTAAFKITTSIQNNPAAGAVTATAATSADTGTVAATVYTTVTASPFTVANDDIVLADQRTSQSGIITVQFNAGALKSTDTVAIVLPNFSGATPADATSVCGSAQPTFAKSNSGATYTVTATLAADFDSSTGTALCVLKFSGVTNPTAAAATPAYTILITDVAGSQVKTMTSGHAIATATSAAVKAFAADPTFSPAAGNVAKDSALTLTSAGATTICLRADGTAPACETDGTCSTGSTAYNATAKPTITAAITWKAIGCAGTGKIDSAVVTAAYDAVAATTAAPTPTTTVSGASSEAAWSTMLTVFAIAMAAFSTL